MKAVVDQEMCIGCGLCVQLAPGVFEMEGAVAVAGENDIDEAYEARAKSAMEKCPVGAITIS